MNRQHFTTIEEAQTFVEGLYKENKWVIKASRGTDDLGGYNVEWFEHKKYVAFDGKEYPDEVWTTEKGEMILIQDLTEAHAKNIIRMMLLNERMQTQAYSAMLDSLRAAIMSGDTEDNSTEPTNDPAPAASEESFTLPDNVFAIKGNTTLN